MECPVGPAPATGRSDVQFAVTEGLSTSRSVSRAGFRISSVPAKARYGRPPGGDGSGWRGMGGQGFGSSGVPQFSEEDARPPAYGAGLPESGGGPPPGMGGLP